MACIRKRRGRYVIDFYDQTGRRRWHTLPLGTGKKEATELLGEIERKIRQGSFLPGPKMPYFSDVAESWLISKEPNIRHTTFDQYKGHIKNHLNPYFGTLKINQISFDLIDKFKKEAIQRNVNIATLREILVTLNSLMTHAVRARYIDFNPAIWVERPRGKSAHDESKEMITLKPDVIIDLLDVAATQKDKILFMTAILTGMREGELLGLKWDDIDWRNSQIFVRRTYNHGHFYETKTKASRRKIDLAPELVHELKKWKLACPIGEEDLVFPTEVGTSEDATNMLKRRFWPALRRARLPVIRFHNLRHTYASLLIAQGEHPKYIQSQMGHSSIKVTMDIYGHLMENTNQDAATRLGKMVFGSSFEKSGSKMVAETKKEVAQ